MPISKLPFPDSNDVSSLGSAIDSYARLLSHPNPASPQELRALAETTVKLDKLSQLVAHTASPAIKGTAEDLEKLLKSPLPVSESKDVSILTAAEHYLENPSTAELGPLVKELCHNSFALKVMHDELTILSNSVKKL